MKCILPPWPVGVEINPIWPRSDLDKVVIAEEPVESVSDILLFLITLSLEYKTKYFVLCRFVEVCSENNEVNEEAKSKRLEREC